MPNEEGNELAAPEEGTIAAESATGEPQEPQAEPTEPEKQGGIQKRIDELTRKQREAQREAEFWRKEALKDKPEAPKPAEPEAAKDKPKSDDFETQEAYVDALTDWKLDQRAKADTAKQKEEELRAEKQRQQTTFQVKTEEFKAKVADFDDVIAGADIQVSQAVIHEILTNDRGPELQYFLAKNPSEADRLNKLSPLALAREVGRLETRYTTTPAAQASVTRTPAPITPIRAASTASVKDPGEMTPAEYDAWRSKTYPHLR